MNQPSDEEMAPEAGTEEFIRVWQASTSRQQVADQLRTSVRAASQKAVRYRRLGIPLKHMPVSKTTITNVAYYATLAESELKRFNETGR